MAVRHVVDRVAFEIPDQLEDATSYVFVDDGGDEEVTVELEVPAATASAATAVVEHARQGLTLTFPDSVIRLDERETTLDGRPARQLDYAVGDSRETTTGCMVVAERDGGGFVKVHLRSRAPQRLQQRLLPCLDTVSLSGAERPAPGGGDYRHVAAGPVALCVPDELRGPSQRLFVDSDERLRLQLVVRPLGRGAAPLDRAIARDARGGWQVLDRQDQRWAHGRWARYRRYAEGTPPRETSVVRAEVEVPLAPGPQDATTQAVELHGYTEPARARTLFAALDMVLRSLKEAS